MVCTWFSDGKYIAANFRIDRYSYPCYIGCDGCSKLYAGWKYLFRSGSTALASRWIRMGIYGKHHPQPCGIYTGIISAFAKEGKRNCKTDSFGKIQSIRGIP